MNRSKKPVPPLPIVRIGAELDILHDALESAREFRGNILLFSGEPGIGKTTLMKALLSECISSSNRNKLFPLLASYRDSVTTPYYLLDEIEDQLAIKDKGFDIFSFLEQNGRVLRFLGGIASYLAALHIPGFFPELVLAGATASFMYDSGIQSSKGDSLTVGSRVAEQGTNSLGGHVDKRFEKVIRRMQSLSKKMEAVILVIDDVQWIDPSSLEFLSFLAGAP